MISYKRKTRKRTNKKCKGGNPNKRSRSSNDRILDDCPICLSEINRNNDCGIAPCGHIYHVSCLMQLARTTTTLCPLCRKDMSIRVEEPELIDLT